MTQGTLRETTLETTCELCSSVTDELERGPFGLYVCPDCVKGESLEETRNVDEGPRYNDPL